MKTRDEAVALAKTIEHEPRFTCSVTNIGKPRQPRWIVNVTDAWIQTEVRPFHYEQLNFAVSNADFWAEARESLKHMTLDGRFVVV